MLGYEAIVQWKPAIDHQWLVNCPEMKIKEQYYAELLQLLYLYQSLSLLRLPFSPINIQ